MRTVSIKSSQTTIAQLLSYTKNDPEPISIELENESVVLIPKSLWQDIEATLDLLSINGMRDSLIDGKNTPLSECSTELDW
jgi:PHD/YefM family antitoxin component YafN of YafNO toxin-antitoxin module